MPGEGELAELRMLQQKAYGRGGGLTAAESRRLHELEDAHRTVPGPERVAVEHDGSESAHPLPPEPIGVTEDRPRIAASTPTAPDLDVSPPPETLGGALRWHAVAVVATAAVLLAIGVGAGWALFASREASLPLTEEQQQRRAELAAELFDPASIRAIAQKDEALAWYATQESGEKLCLILDVGARSEMDCISSDQVGVGLSAVLPLPPEAGAEEGTVDSEVVAASLVFSTTGEPLVAIQRWSMASSILGSFEGAERERAEALIGEGYELGLSKIGSFHGEAVWLADRVAEQGATERCMIVDATDAVSCVPFETALQDGLGAQKVGVDDGIPVVWVLDLRFTAQQTPYLTITEAPVTVVGPGETVLVEAPPGDPIEVEPPGRGTDD